MDDLMRDLIDAIRQQTAAIQQLVESNAALIQAMAESEMVDGELGGDQYLDDGTLD